MAGKDKEVAVKDENTGVAAVDMGVLDFNDFGNTGFEGADKDSFAIPFIQLLQKMSPKVDEDHAEYIPGAKAGMLLNTVTGQLYDGKTGVVVIPCAYKRSYILWGGREGDGGFKGEFTVEEFEELLKDETKVKVVEGRAYVPDADGNINEKKSDYYSDTRSHFLIVLDPDGGYGTAILSMASSQIKASKKLMTSLQQKKVETPKGLQTPPTFANLVKITTSGRSNDQGSWSGIDFELVGLVKDANHYKAAKEFYLAVVGGEAKADFSKADPAGSGAGEPDSKPQSAQEF